MLLDLLIATVAVPVLFTAIFLLAGRWPAGREVRRPAWGTLVAVGAAYAAAHLALLGRPPFPPVTASEWILYGALGALIAAALQRAWPASPWAAWIPRLILVLVLVPLIARPLMQHTWTVMQSVLGVAGTILAWLVFWAFLDRASRDESRRVAWPLTLAVIAGGTSVVLMLSGSAKYGQLAGALAVAAGVWWLFSMAWERARSGNGSAAVPAFVLGGLAAAGHLFAEMPVLSFALVSVAPVAADLGGMLASKWRKRWAAAALEAVLAGLVVAVAVLPPLIATLAAQSQDGYY
jgi:hypothetical protein